MSTGVSTPGGPILRTPRPPIDDHQIKEDSGLPGERRAADRTTSCIRDIDLALLHPTILLQIGDRSDIDSIQRSVKY